MEEKIYELMTKMYSEMQNGFQRLEARQDTLEKGQTKLETGQAVLEKGLLKLENEFKEAKMALFDGYNQTYEKLEALEKKVDKLAATVESHDVKIEVIRGVK